MTITSEGLADLLLKGGYAASVENFLLSEDRDVPIYPECLVQVEVAKCLRGSFGLTAVELEVGTERLLRIASGHKLDDSEFPTLERPGEIDIVGWNSFVPQVFVEVKDQITGTDDGVVADVLRMQELLAIAHRWGSNSPQAKAPRFGAVLYFVGKNAWKRKRQPHLASQLIPYADRTVATSLKNVRKVVDSARFQLTMKKVRVFGFGKRRATESRVC